MDRLSIRNLEVRYGDLIGVADVSLDVPLGSVVALVGSNGAGKTTTLNAIAGLVPASSGAIEWQGKNITRQPAYAIVSKGLALSPEGWQLFVSQTVEQNLRLGTTSLKDRSRAAPLFERVYELFPRLKERRSQFAGTLSGGERQMLALGRALMAKPKLLLLDEPSLGLSPRARNEMMDAVTELCRAHDLTALVAEQDMDMLGRAADRWHVLRNGRIVYTGVPGELGAEAMRNIYMGLEPEPS